MDNNLSTHIAALLCLLAKGQPLDQQQQQLLNNWLAESEKNRTIQRLFINGDQREALMKELHEVRIFNAAALSGRVGFEVEPFPVGTAPVIRSRTNWNKFLVAASVVLITGAIGYLAFPPDAQKNVQQLSKTTTAVHSTKLLPGHDQAIITLDDGRQVPLDSGASQIIGLQGAAVVSQQRGGLLNYQATEHPGPTVYNTITTPKGGQFKIILSDGTKVWVNAASKLRFATSFSTTERHVELQEGEAYFEVAKDAQRPFSVSITALPGHQQKVFVIGTHFNVSAYRVDEASAVTLLEGIVKVQVGSQDKVLRPGQQTILHNDDRIEWLEGVDINNVVSWKDGLLQFEDEPITSVLKKLSRWYDFDVVYEGTPPPFSLTASFSRETELSEILNSIVKLGANIKIEGRLLTVYHE